MIIKEVKIQNFGSYRNLTEFNLFPNGLKKITLIGGNNGAGKSTLLEALKCCLYGKRSQGARIRDIDFNNYLIARRNYLHASSEKSIIEVSFIFYNLGEPEEYTVRRKWSVLNGVLKQNFTLLKNGFRFSGVNEADWQEFILDLIPPYVLDLYLFDAEDLKGLAINEGSNVFLEKSIKMILGLHYAEQLNIDLDYQLTLDINEGDDEIEQEIKYKRDLLVNYEKEIMSLKQDLAGTNTKIKRSQLELTRLEDDFRTKGGIFAKKRDENKEKKNNIQSELDEIENNIRQSATELMPFLIVKNKFSKIQQILYSERKSQIIKEMTGLIQEKKENLQENISRSIVNDLKILDQLEKMILTQFNYKKENSSLSTLSVKDLATVENAINLVIQTEDEINSLFHIGNNIVKSINKINRDLDLTPNNDYELEDDFSSIKEKISEIEKLKIQYKEIEEKINSTNYNIKLTTSEFNKLNIELSKKKENQEVRLKILSVKRVLNKFIKINNQQKLLELGEAIKDKFSSLCRKSKSLSKIEIDPENYNIKLYGSYKELWEKDYLSRGEKQLLAISILWSLAEVSDKELPFIIDTPLGKLDDEHKKLLVNEFFIQNQSQVIILSTNEEIDQELFIDIKPYLNRTYLIDFDPNEQYTKLSDGYFFN
ncbi:MAG: DNA sulfur modification protein DndD [Candidatus Heimdallarchaeota archaeon]|nr:DNA sulfur modification protein DndD [Candidatus Heimdallarchaeota archaeon]